MFQLAIQFIGGIEVDRFERVQSYREKTRQIKPKSSKRLRESFYTFCSSIEKASHKPVVATVREWLIRWWLAVDQIFTGTLIYLCSVWGAKKYCSTKLVFISEADKETSAVMAKCWAHDEIFSTQQENAHYFSIGASVRENFDEKLRT